MKIISSSGSFWIVNLSPFMINNFIAFVLPLIQNLAFLCAIKVFDWLFVETTIFSLCFLWIWSIPLMQNSLSFCFLKIAFWGLWVKLIFGFFWIFTKSFQLIIWATGFSISFFNPWIKILFSLISLRIISGFFSSFFFIERINNLFSFICLNEGFLINSLAFPLIVNLCAFTGFMIISFFELISIFTTFLLISYTIFIFLGMFNSLVFITLLWSFQLIFTSGSSEVKLKFWVEDGIKMFFFFNANILIESILFFINDIFWCSFPLILNRSLFIIKGDFFISFLDPIKLILKPSISKTSIFIFTFLGFSFLGLPLTINFVDLIGWINSFHFISIFCSIFCSSLGSILYSIFCSIIGSTFS